MLSWLATMLNMELQMRRFSIPGLLVALIALAGCGSSSSPSHPSSTTPAAPATSSSSASSTAAPATSPGGALKLAADPSGALKFDTSSLSARAGKLTIDFANNSSLGHNVTVASRSGTVLGATPTFQGGTKTLTLDLKPGTYVFYCSVPGHRQAGMQGTLVVR
jgi:plastocyanin